MSKRKCECSNFITLETSTGGLQTGACIAEKCILNEPKYVTQAEAEKIAYGLQQEYRKREKDKEKFPPSSMVFWILRKFNIQRMEGDLDG